MPGIDKNRFINIREIEDYLLCGICLAVFGDPKVTQCCQQTYCSDCIGEWIKTRKTCPNCRKALTNRKLSQPPRLVVNLLNKQKIKCDFAENGCLEEIWYLRYKQHIKDCRYRPEAICGKCGEKNGQRGAHNCVNNLVAKYKCEQNNNKVLETKNKQLIDRNANLENLLLSLKKNQEIEINSLNVKKKYTEELNKLNERMITVKKNLNETITQLNEKLRQKDGEIEEYRPFVEENKKLIDRNAKLENDLLILNKKYEENISSTFGESKHEWNDANKRSHNDMTATIKTEAGINIKAEPQHTDNSIDNHLIPEHAIKREKDDSYCNAKLKTDLLNLKKIHDEELKELSKKLNHYIVELSDEKNKSSELTNEFNERLRQKDSQIEEFPPLLEHNKKLNEKIKLLMKNIERLSFIEQTTLDKTRFELKVTTDKLTHQYLYGNAVNIRGLCWNIKVKLFIEDSIEYLSLYLECRSESEIWSCIASTEMSIKPQYKVQFPFKNAHRFSCVYSNGQNCFGYEKFIRRSNLFDVNYGYVKDNMFLISVCFSIW